MNACPHEPVTLRPDELEIPLPEIRTISKYFYTFFLCEKFGKNLFEISCSTQMVLLTLEDSIGRKNG